MASSGMLRRVCLVRTDVSGELSASFIRVKRIGELRTRIAITSNRPTLRRNRCDQYGHMLSNYGYVRKQRNIDIIQRYQNKVLRCLVNAPWYARNSDIHRDLRVETVASIVTRHAISHGNRLHHHVNEEASRLLTVQHLIRPLKRTEPFELVKQFDN
jgi:hypothetical protein